MLTTIEGTYNNGHIELAEEPKGISSSKVLITFLEEQPKLDGEIMTLGMFAGPIETSEEDFKLAEWHGDPDDGLDWTGA